MNVCLLSLDYPSSQEGGGVGTQTRALARGLASRGHTVRVVALTYPGTTAGVEDDDGVAVHRVQRGNLHWYASRLPLVGRTLAPALREVEDGWHLYLAVRRLRPLDVVETTETGALGVMLLMRGVTRVMRLHGERYTISRHVPGLPLSAGLRLLRSVQRVAIRRASLLIAPSRAHAGEIARELGIDRHSIEIIPNAAVPPGGTAPMDAEDGDPDTGQPIVLYVGRLERSKGVLDLVQAAARVVQAVPDVRFVLAGAAHPTLPREELDALIESCALGARVQLLGHVPRESLGEWYGRATLCVLPSYYESFGLAALEAMAWGVPVVTTTAGGLAEVVQGGRTGILVPPGDVARLADAICTLLRDGHLRRRMGRAGRELALAQLTVERLVDRTLAAYARAGTTGP